MDKLKLIYLILIGLFTVVLSIVNADIYSPTHYWTISETNITYKVPADGIEAISASDNSSCLVITGGNYSNVYCKVYELPLNYTLCDEESDCENLTRKTCNFTSNLCIGNPPISTVADSGAGGGLDESREDEVIITPGGDWDFVVEDGICQYSLGEDRFNSKGDCKPSLVEYSQCLVSKDNCFDKSMWSEASLFFGLFLIVILSLYKLNFLSFFKNK